MNPATPVTNQERGLRAQLRVELGGKLNFIHSLSEDRLPRRVWQSQQHSNVGKNQ